MTSYAITEEGGRALKDYRPGMVGSVLRMNFRDFTEAGIVPVAKKEAIVKGQVLVMSVREMVGDGVGDYVKGLYTENRPLVPDDMICLKYENNEPVISIATPEEVDKYLITADPLAHDKINKAREALHDQVVGALFGCSPEEVRLARAVKPSEPPTPYTKPEVDNSFSMGPV